MTDGLTPADEIPWTQLQRQGIAREQVALVLVDHGSRREESNQMLLSVTKQFQELTGWPNVWAAHMELAEPSIDTAFDQAVRQGARLIVVFPYFLAPGRHWHQDIPRLAASAAARHEGVKYLVTAPLGIHELIMRVVQDRMTYCLRVAAGEEADCTFCSSRSPCTFLPVDE